MPEPIAAARAEVFRLWIESDTEEGARAKALSWAIAEPNLREPRVVEALPRDGVRDIWTVEVHAVVVLERPPGWYRLPTLEGGRLDLLPLERAIALVLARYSLGGRSVGLGLDVVDAVRHYIETGGTK